MMRKILLNNVKFIFIFLFLSQRGRREGTRGDSFVAIFGICKASDLDVNMGEDRAVN